MNTHRESAELPTPIQRIRAKMQAQHVSQQELGDRLHMSSSSISRLLQGETMLSFDIAVQISHILQMPLDEIAGRSAGHEGHRSIEHVTQLYERRLESVRDNHARLVSELKEAHAHELNALHERYNDRQRFLSQQYELRIADLMRDRRIMRITLAALLVLFFGFVIADLSIGSRGWVQYTLAPALDGLRNVFSSRI